MESFCVTRARGDSQGITREVEASFSFRLASPLLKCKPEKKTTHVFLPCCAVQALKVPTAVAAKQVLNESPRQVGQQMSKCSSITFPLLFPSPFTLSCLLTLYSSTTMRCVTSVHFLEILSPDFFLFLLIPCFRKKKMYRKRSNQLNAPSTRIHTHICSYLFGEEHTLLVCFVTSASLGNL